MEKEYTEKQMDSAYDVGFKHGQEKSTVLRDDGKQYLTEKHSLHGERVTWSMNGFDGVGIVVDVEDDIAHIAVIDSHSTFQTYANLPIEILH